MLGRRGKRKAMFMSQCYRLEAVQREIEQGGVNQTGKGLILLHASA
jgi:hypothetical protein